MRSFLHLLYRLCHLLKYSGRQYCSPVSYTHLTIADTDILPDTTVFSCGSLRFCILPSKVDALPERLGGISRLGCDLIIVPSCDPATAGSVRSSREIAKAVSASTGCAVVVVNGGVGESSAPHIYQGFVCICEDGELSLIHILLAFG